MGTNVNVYLLDHQYKLLESVSPKVCMICGRGAGKSYALSVMALNSLLSGTSNVMVGGQRYETLHDTLYAEIKKRADEWGVYDRIRWRESPMQMEYDGRFIYFGTYESVDAARGYSEVGLLLLDELFLAPVNILAIWAPCMRGPSVKNPRIVGATTPRMDSMWNVMMASPDCDWEIIRATTRDNKFITEDQYNLILSGIRTEEMRRQELEGEIIDSRNNSIITLSEFPTVTAPSLDKTLYAGMDIAEGVERDSTSFFARRGNLILDMWKDSRSTHEQNVARVLDFHKANRIDRMRFDMAFSDYEFNVLKYHIPDCEQVQFARAPSDENRERFANIRAEMAFNLAHLVKSGMGVDGFELSAELKRQMCAVGWKHNSQGRLLITPKDELRAVLNMSTDIMDAAMLTCVDRYMGDEPIINVSRNREDNAMRRRYARMMG